MLLVTVQMANDLRLGGREADDCFSYHEKLTMILKEMNRLKKTSGEEAVYIPSSWYCVSRHGDA